MMGIAETLDRIDPVPLPWRRCDGGRAASGFQGDARDCVARAIAIATGRDYRLVYNDLAEMVGRLPGRSRSAREGVPRKVYEAYLFGEGWTWCPTMRVGSGCTTHLAVGEVPDNCIARLSRHLCAVVDGVVLDNHDPTRGGTRCVYGYYEDPVR